MLRKRKNFTALVDSGSRHSFIVNNVAQAVKLDFKPTKFTISMITSELLLKTVRKCKANLSGEPKLTKYLIYP